MSNIPSDEIILLTFSVYKQVKNSDILSNTVANLISSGLAGKISNEFKLSLTRDNLYIEVNDYSTFGNLPELNFYDKIPLNNIKNFKVENIHDEEHIDISYNEKLDLSFIRKNEYKDNLALCMANLISYIPYFG